MTDPTQGSAPMAPADHGRPWTNRAGWAFIVTVALYVGYLVIALTVGTGYEQDLVDAAEREGATVNTMSASAMAQAVQDHTIYSTLMNLYLFLPALTLLGGVSHARTGARGRSADAAWWSALAGLVVLWAYLLLNFGLLADPQALPPVVRNLDVLTMPMVTASGLLALAAMAFVAEAARGAGVARRAGRVSSILCGILGVLSVAGLFAENADPVPPIVVVPAGLILGIALIRQPFPTTQ